MDADLALSQVIEITPQSSFDNMLEKFLASVAPFERRTIDDLRQVCAKLGRELDCMADLGNGCRVSGVINPPCHQSTLDACEVNLATRLLPLEGVGTVVFPRNSRLNFLFAQQHTPATRWCQSQLIGLRTEPAPQGGHLDSHRQLFPVATEIFFSAAFSMT
jgi:hypothetical protein